MLLVVTDLLLLLLPGYIRGRPAPVVGLHGQGVQGESFKRAAEDTCACKRMGERRAGPPL